MSNRKPPKIDEQVSYNGVFFVFALLFGVITLWAVYDEAFSRRPWKQFQWDFFKLEERLTREDLQKKQQALESDAALKDKRARLAQLRAELEGPKRGAYEQAKRDLTKLEYASMDAERDFTFAKSEWEEAFYYYTVAKHDQKNPPSPEEQERLAKAAEREQSAKAKMQERQQAFEAKAAERDGKKKEVAAFTDEQDALGKDIEKAAQAVAESKRKWEQAKSRATAWDAAEIVQLNLDKLGRVDRCQTCHMAVDTPGFEKVPETVYRTHPMRSTLLRWHPVDKFGCTLCHDGQGRATIIKTNTVFGDATRTVDFVHAPEGEQFHQHYWERPLLTGPDPKGAPDWYRESNCRNCHAQQVDLRSPVWCSDDSACGATQTCAVPASPTPWTEMAKAEAAKAGGEAAPAATPLEEKQCVDRNKMPVLVDLAPHLTKGRRVIEEVGCYGCHAIAGYEGKPKPGPDLRHVASKITNAGWMIEWIKNPKGIRPKSRMPNFWPEALHADEYPKAALRDADGHPIDFAGKRDEEATALAAFLLSASEPFPLEKAPPGDAANGQKLVDSLGCHGCHVLGDKPVEHKNRGSQFDHGPDLRAVGAKVGVDWLYTWLLNPRHYAPETRMPNLRLTDQEAADVAALLASWKGEKEYAAPAGVNLADAALIEKGKTLVTNYGCFGCHLIGGFENRPGIGAELTEFGAKTTDRLDFGDYFPSHHDQTWDNWAFNKLRHPRVYRTERAEVKMPQFDLSDEEVWSVMTVLRGMRGEEPVGDLKVRLDEMGLRRERGRELVRTYNCYGCHSVDGYVGDIRQRYPADQAVNAPPLLNREGAKTQPNWLFGFLKDVQPLRPWLKVRMPTFSFKDEEATSLGAMFSALDHATYPYEYVGDVKPLAPEQADLAHKSFDMLQCIKCHIAGTGAGALPRVTTEAPTAPDLALARRRLRPDWVMQWLANPQTQMPGTQMPNFFGPEPDQPNQYKMMLDIPQYSAAFGPLLDQAKALSQSTTQTIRLLRDFLFTFAPGAPDGRDGAPRAQAGGAVTTRVQ